MKKHEILTKEGLTNSQMYTRDNTHNLTIREINFTNRFINSLIAEDPEISRADFSNLITDVFTHYRNIRSSKENVSFFDIGNEFTLK